MRLFGSDNNSGVDQRILKYIVEEGDNYGRPYGEDETTKLARQIIEEELGKKANIYFVTTGTAANIIGLSSFLRSHEAVIAGETAHINVDECNALERFNGSKILTVPSYKGKIIIEDLEKVIRKNRGVVHSSQPKIISISQLTETGSYYSSKEIKELADFAHENKMYLHVDGARIANALEITGESLKEMIGDTGVDIFSFGGTKNGMMIGEAIVDLTGKNDELVYRVKQGMQLLSKTRYIACQFIAYLKDNLWIENAKNANEMGRLLNKELEKIEGIEILDYSDSNILFIRMPREEVDSLSQELYFYISDEDSESKTFRLITSFDSREEEVMDLVNLIKKHKK